jgi:hypothetical protein
VEPVGELPAKNLRVWTEAGLSEHGIKKTSVPPQTGGTIIFEDAAGNIGVEWDTGPITVHRLATFGAGLICIGKHTTLDDYLRQL